MDSLEGHVIGRYEMLELLGEGGMARVYKALDTRLERHVAVKVIRKENFSPVIMVHVLKRFEREAKSLAQLSHPNIVKVIDYGEYESAPYLVLEYLSGGTLKSRLGQQMHYQKAALLLLPIARALSYAHQRGVIHRDIKPSNILISESGEPMLADFGLVKILETTEKESLTSSGVAVGTPEYMAPEQGLGLSIDSRSDIYSLGIVFFEMLTGKKPFAADTPMAIVLKHVSEPLPRPQLLVPSLPELVEQVLVKALAKDPADRYQEMESFASALSMLIANEKTASYPGSEGQMVKNRSSETLDEKNAIIPDRSGSNGEDAKVQARIIRLESVIAESIKAEDFDDIDSMLLKLETLGENGRQSAQRLRAEMIRAQNASHQRDAKIDRLKNEIQQGIEKEDFTQSEALLQSLFSLGPRGQDQAAVLKEALDSARQQAVQRRAEIYRLTALVERQLADGALELVSPTLGHLKILGEEGKKAAERWELELKKARQQSEQNEKEIATEVTQVELAIRAEDFTQAAKFIANLKLRGSKAQVQIQRLETELEQAQRVAAAAQANQTGSSADKVTTGHAQEAYPAPYGSAGLFTKARVEIPFFRRGWFIGVLILAVFVLCISVIAILATFLPAVLTSKTTPAEGILSAGGALTATEAAVTLQPDLKPTIPTSDRVTLSPTEPPHTATQTLYLTETFTPSATPRPVFEVKINIAAANIRSGPGTVYSIVANRLLGDIVDAVGRNEAGDWLVVTLDAKTTGWISTKVVEYSFDASLLPVVSAPPTPVIQPTKPDSNKENPPQQPPPTWTVPPP